MNKWGSILFLIVVAIFGSIIFVTQMNLQKTKQDNPTLPPEADTFRAIALSPTQGQQQQQATNNTQPQPTFGVEAGIKASYSAVIKTTKGAITVTLRGDAAPRTVKNFLEKAQSGFYKNLTFHRVEDWVIQGGDPKGDGTGGGLIQTELNILPFVAGSLGVARGNNINISNDSQFFITKSDAHHLDQQYTNFGIVTDGMDVVEKIRIGDKILGITIQE